MAPVTAGWREKTKVGFSQVSYPLRFCGISLGSLEIRLCPSHLIILQACGTDLHKTHIKKKKKRKKQDFWEADLKGFLSFFPFFFSNCIAKFRGMIQKTPPLHHMHTSRSSVHARLAVLLGILFFLWFQQRALLLSIKALSVRTICLPALIFFWGGG